MQVTDSSETLPAPLALTHPWFAVRVRSNFEKISSIALRDRGLEVFLPTFQRQRQWSDRLKQTEAPLFPGYLFARLDLQNRLPVITAPGIVQIVGIAKTPVAVPDGEIDAVRAVLESRLPYEPWPSVVVGQRVVVRKGALTGIEGTLIQVKRRFRLLVSVELLQRAVSVEVEADWIRPLTGPVRQERAAADLISQTGVFRQRCSKPDELALSAL